MHETALMPQTRVLVDDGRLLIRHADSVNVIAGADGVRLLRNLLEFAEDGRLPIPDVDGSDAEELVAALMDRLEEAELICSPEATEVSPTARNLWMRQGRAENVEDIDERLSTAHLALTGSGPLHDRIHAGLSEAGAAPTGSFEGSDMLVVVASHADDESLADANAYALEHRVPWLPVVEDDGRRSLVGPYIVPHSSACWQCVRLRRAANFPDRSIAETLARAETLSTTTSPAGSVGLELIAAGTVVEKVTERLAIGDYASATRPGSLAEIRLTAPGIGIEEHQVLRVPRCDACSPAAGRGQPLVWFHPEGASR